VQSFYACAGAKAVRSFLNFIGLAIFSLCSV